MSDSSSREGVFPGLMLGIALALLPHLVAAVLVGGLAWLGAALGGDAGGALALPFLAEFAAPGLVQALWVVPLAAYYFVKGRRPVAYGLIGIGAVVFLLNSACWGIGLFLMGGMDFR